MGNIKFKTNKYLDKIFPIFRVPRLDLVISETSPDKAYRSNRRILNQRDQLRVSYQNRFQRLGQLPHADSAPFHLDQMQADGAVVAANNVPSSSSSESAAAVHTSNTNDESMGYESTTVLSTQRRRHHNIRRRLHQHNGHHNVHRNSNSNNNNNNNPDGLVDVPTQ